MGELSPERRLKRSIDRQAGSRPVPFQEGDEGGLLPFSGLSVQVRGTLPLGSGDGIRAEYALYATNGPRFASDVRGRSSRSTIPTRTVPRAMARGSALSCCRMTPGWVDCVLEPQPLTANGGSIASGGLPPGGLMRRIRTAPWRCVHVCPTAHFFSCAWRTATKFPSPRVRVS